LWYAARMLNRLTGVAGCALAVILSAGLAMAKPIAFVGGLVIPGDGPEIAGGVVVIDGGKITAVGEKARVTIPADADVRDCTGKVVMPGLVDTHSHIGGVGGADGSSPIQPSVRVLDSINVRDTGFRRARAGGLTTLNVMPGSGHLLSGETVYLKLREGKTIEEMAYLSPEGVPLGGIKMANGTNPMRDPPFPGTRGKSAALVREQFIRAQEYRDKVQKAGGEKDKLPPRDLGLEALVTALDGTKMVHHHTHRADDIITVLRLKKEFGFRVTLHHVSEAWKVADEIAAAGVPCSVIWVDAPGGKLEASEKAPSTAAILVKAGVKVVFHTDDWITDSRFFFRMAAMGVRAGLSREAAIRALTINGAEILDLADRTGSLKVGKDADVIVLSGDPFSVYTHVEETWVEGKRVFDRKNPADRLFATGGYGAGKDSAMYLCCAGSGWMWRNGGSDVAGEGGE
jgi:imidazolonepropionase-like amidohydrolase